MAEHRRLGTADPSDPPVPGDPAACRRDGCDGTLEDGYCDTCGLAAGPLQGVPVVPPAPAPGRSYTGSEPGTALVRPGHGPAGGTRADEGFGSDDASSDGPTAGSDGSRTTRRGTTRSQTDGSAPSRLGAGMVDVPAVPPADPASALLVDPHVAEDRRYCSRCGRPVGRHHDGRPGRAAGFCASCGARFSFVPALLRGTLVAGQYEVQGCLAYGGLGWIYLALDRNVDDRWVVLKGLLDSADADAAEVAAAERGFLAQVSHPNIVTIYNFVEHAGADGGPVGYIVMEYVGGSSLKQLMQARRRDDGTLEPLPVAQSIAYALEALPALGHLHALGLAYCDFKPDNVIQYDRQLKLIDLGAVIRLDDERSPIYGTVGYQAPEIARDGPSPGSDLYTVGRTLAVLALGIAPARHGTTVELPDPAAHPVLAAHESFHRLLRRATHADPARRFGSAGEMAGQLTAVLREVLAAEDGQPRPGRSTVFGPPRGTFASGLLGSAAAPGRPDPGRVAALLPVPLVDTTDPMAGMLATASATDPAEVLRLAAVTPESSPELLVRVVRAHLDSGDPESATATVEALAADDPDDWRVPWFLGVAALVAGDAATACPLFDDVLDVLPGEAAPKLALAAAAECAGWDDVAARYHALVGGPDPSLADAAFGLARVALRAGQPAAASRALDAVPESSSQYEAAQLAAVRAMLVGGADARVGEAELRDAAARVERLPLDAETDHEIRAALLAAAVELVAGTPAAPGADSPAAPPLLGSAWTERDLRLALEGHLRARARLAADPDERMALVDRANAVRPRTWV